MKVSVTLGGAGQPPLSIGTMKLSSKDEPAWAVSEPPATLEGVSDPGERSGSVRSGFE